MIRFFRKKLRLIENRKGQSTAEYVLILAIVVMLVLKFKSSFVDKIGNTSEKLGDKVENIIDQIDDYN